MFVSDRMTRDVVTIDESGTVREAAELIAERRIHQLPVVREKQCLVGIVTDRDLRSVHDPEMMAGPVSAIMSRDPITVWPGSPLEDALLLLYRHRFGALPVTVAAAPDCCLGKGMHRLVGIISRTDILAALIEMLGIEEAGTRIEVELPEQSAVAVVGVINAVAQTQTRVVSLTLSGPRGRQSRRLYIRLSTIDPRRAIDALREAGYTIAHPSCDLI
ncbi:MAG: Inosine-5'-monophosphate dehydrogenase [Phycisphaerae bacterium]|nr:Inosine-5'-monophosphate dehydrogenase [Phycisphaerae bacterium]